MSSMLEQAIIDAKALKEAAVKNAESEILEKYSHEIKQAVNSLLEQAEDDLAPEGGADDQFLEQFPNAATSGANFGDQPIDSELVEIDFDQLVAEGVQLDEEEEIEEGLVGDVVKGAAKMAAGAAIDASWQA